MKRTYILNSDADRRNAMVALRAAPEGYTVTLEPYERRRNAEQNALYWSRLQEISEVWNEGGVYYTKDGLHEAFADALLPKKEVQIPGGKTKLVRKSTTELTVAEFSDYLERIAAWAAQKGIEFMES